MSDIPSGEKRYALSAEKKEAISAFLRVQLQQQQEVRFAFVHGSFLDLVPCRDVDVALYFADDTPPELQDDLCLTLNLECSHALGLPTDFRSLNTAGLDFRYAASQGRVLLARDEDECADFRVRTWLEYWDFAPLAEQTLFDLLERSHSRPSRPSEGRR